MIPLSSNILVWILIVFCMLNVAFGQDSGNERSADRTLRGSGRVNASTLAMEFDLPLGSYAGRGINVPISLSYSSKLWRMDYFGDNPVPGSQWSTCYPHYNTAYSEESASGWATSLAVPYVEYVGMTGHYDNEGKPVSNYDVTCPTSGGGGGALGYNYIRRIVVHLPSGETHELRPDDLAIAAPGNGSSGTSPYNPDNWNATYYAADGSNLKYIQSAATNTYRLLMPDGSFYDFDGAAGHGDKRKAVRFTDRNGNFTTYYGPGSVDSSGVTHPNGYWRDTIGRNISVPIGLQASAPTPAHNPHVYSLPGLTGTYKLHWKLLKGSAAAESGLTDFSQNLKYHGNTYVCHNSQGYPTYCTRPAETALFHGDGWARVMGHILFNPVVLTEIELPTGQKYKFSYDVYGRIEKITYPTGGEEVFQYGVVAPLSTLDPTDGVGGQTNFGVINRKVYPTAGQSNHYQWTYSNSGSTTDYAVVINNPDGTRTERYLHPGRPWSYNPTPFGYDNLLAGMAKEERAYDNSNPRKLVSKKLTGWTTSGAWHPRVAQEESIIYDSLNNGISTSTTFEYDGDLNLRETPVLMKKSSQYAFVPVGSPLPATPVKVSESTFLMNDPNIPQPTKDAYRNQNMVALVTASQIKDGSGTVVSRSEMVYDESGRSPGYRGNPTTAKVWDSTKGVVTNSSAYILTSARFDTYGNQYEATDAKNNTTTTTFDSTYQAFPIQVTSPVPSDGVHGSNTAFVTTATFDTTTGLPLTTTDANGIETRIAYDPVTLRPLNTKTYFNNVQVGSTAETIYNDQAGNYWVKNRAQIDTNIWAESITYFDGLGRAWKSEEINSKGNIFVEKEFDAQGRVKRVSNPFRAGEPKVWTTNVYDEASRVKEVILQDGATVKTDYGVSVSGLIGVTKQITDQAGKKRKGISDALGRMIRVIEDPTGTPLYTDYVFDTLGNLRKTIQGEQNRFFMHDSLGRLLYAKQPEQDTRTAFVATDPITSNTGWSVKYEYDDNSNITKTTDARGVFVAGTYDNLNRLKVRDYSDTTPGVSFYYDGKYLNAADVLQTATGSVKGKTTGVKSSVSRTNYTSFDNLGRLLTHQQITDGQTYGTSYTYNLSGGIVSETYPSNRLVTYDINADGDLSRVWGQKGSAVSTYANAFNYNTSGAVEKLRLGNGKWETAAYNNRLQITQIGLGNGSNDASLLKLNYDYGTSTLNNGGLREQKINYAGLPSEIKQTYTYDDLNRLKSSTETHNGTTQSWKETFTYDRYGNRRFDAGNTTTLSQFASWKVTNPHIETTKNRLKKDQDNDTFLDYDYDAAGNVTLDAEAQRFVYDAENRQTQFFGPTNQTQTPDATYHYDGDGRRVKKISNTETTVFVYNAGGTLVAEYSTALNPTPRVGYLTSDHLGSPRIITDQLAAVVSRHDYTGFGKDVAETLGNIGGRTGTYGVDDKVRKQYTGYERDDESGLEYAQARYFKSDHGRYTSPDPLMASGNVRNSQSLNRYSYVLNSPYKFVDPLGLLSVTTGACGSSCANSEVGLPTDSGYNDITKNFLQQEVEPPVIYVFVFLTNEEMTLNKTKKAPDFSALVEQGKKNGIDVRIVTQDSGTGLSEANATHKGMFIQALKDPNALGVVFVGHGLGSEGQAGFTATGLLFAGDGEGNESNSLYTPEISGITDIKARFIGLVGCDVDSVATAFPGKTPILALDGGTDGETSNYGIGQVGFSMAESLSSGKGVSQIEVKSNNTLKAVQNLKIRGPDKTLVDKGDKVVNPKAGWPEQ